LLHRLHELQDALEHADGWRISSRVESLIDRFSLPGDADYSPLWALQIYDPRAFSLVHDEATARRARVMKEGPLVNCPVVRWRHD